MDFNFCLNMWSFAKEAFEGSGGFADGTYIDNTNSKIPKNFGIILLWEY